MKELIDKILNVQNNLEAPKSRHNDFGGYDYRSTEDILTALKPLLFEQGLMQTVSDQVTDRESGTYVMATVTVTDGENEVSTTAFARETNNRKKMNPPQLTGSASSYARKYALNGMWNIDDVKDADTGAHNPQNSQSKQKQKDDKEWLNESDKERWMKAEKFVKNGGNPSKLRTKYKVSKADMKYFQDLSA